MSSKFKYIVMSSLIAVTLNSVNLASAEDLKKALPQVSVLSGYDGKGYCTVKQRGDGVVSFAVRVINATPDSITTAWLKFDDKTIARLDGTVADASGAADLDRTFRVGANVAQIKVDVRDHNRPISTIVSDDDLAVELSQSSNAITGESIRMGTCSFKNIIYK